MVPLEIICIFELTYQLINYLIVAYEMAIAGIKCGQFLSELHTVANLLCTLSVEIPCTCN